MDNHFYHPGENRSHPQLNHGQPPSYWSQQPVGHHYPNAPFTYNHPPQPYQHGGGPPPPHPPLPHPQPQQQRQQQQQQQVVVVGGRGQSSSGYIPVRYPTVSMLPAIILSCFVFWFCGCLFGLVAFILAMIGQSSSVAGDRNGATQLRNASYGVSIAGIVIGLIIISLAVALSAKSRRGSYYSYDSYYYSNYYYNSYYSDYNYYSSYNPYPSYYKPYYKTCSSYSLGYRYYYACK